MDRRRIVAWVLLAGFVLLLANLIFIHYKMMLSIGIYSVIAVFFLIAKMSRK